jgi:hypothetical protein
LRPRTGGEQHRGDLLSAEDGGVHQRGEAPGPGPARLRAARQQRPRGRGVAEARCEQQRRRAVQRGVA